MRELPRHCGRRSETCARSQASACTWGCASPYKTGGGWRCPGQTQEDPPPPGRGSGPPRKVQTSPFLAPRRDTLSLKCWHLCSRILPGTLTQTSTWGGGLRLGDWRRGKLLGVISMLSIFFVEQFFFFGSAHVMQRSLHQGLNPHHGSHPSHSSDNAGSLTR